MLSDAKHLKALDIFDFFFSFSPLNVYKDLIK